MFRLSPALLGIHLVQFIHWKQEPELERRQPAQNVSSAKALAWNIFRVGSVGRVFSSSSFGAMPPRLADDASVRVRSWGLNCGHSKQHLVQERRKTNPLNSPQKEQSRKQKMAKKSDVKMYRPALVLRKARNALRQCSMASWYSRRALTTTETIY